MLGEHLHRHVRMAALGLEQLLGQDEVGVRVVAGADPLDRQPEHLGCQPARTPRCRRPSLAVPREAARQVAGVGRRVAVPVVVQVDEDLAAGSARRRSGAASRRARRPSSCRRDRGARSAGAGRRGCRRGRPREAAGACRRRSRARRRARPAAPVPARSNQLGWRNSKQWRALGSLSRAAASRSSSRWKFSGSCQRTGPRRRPLRSGSSGSQKRATPSAMSCSRFMWVR